jgi:membrane-bound lytic murein transglycosylase D
MESSKPPSTASDQPKDAPAKPSTHEGAAAAKGKAGTADTKAAPRKSNGAAPKGGGNRNRKDADAAKPIVNPNSTEADPELVALDRAERVLFPQALRGIRPTFSFETDGDWAAINRPSSEAKPPEDAWYRELVLPQIYPNIDGRILTYLEFYRSSAEGKAILRAWTKKRGKYEAAIVSTLTKNGVPRELLWQCLAESALNPTIRSPAGAAGLWQFMPETAKMYGLIVDRWLDERLDPERATAAAAKMMSDLFERMGNWELALAAYNMGEAGLLRAIRKYNTNDFWTLSRYEAGLPWETALYVPRIVAITIAMSNPRTFGIDDIVPDEPVAVDTVLLSAGQPLSAVARAAGIAESELAELNPQLLAGRLPPALGKERGTVRVYVPRGRGEQVRNRLSRGSGPEPDLESYAMKRGETLDSVALVRGTSVETLRSINGIANGESMEPGTIILVPRTGSASLDPSGAEDERVAVVPPDVKVPKDQRRVFYRVGPGDTLSSIAEAFSVTRAELLELNSLDPSAKLQPSLLLQISLPKDAKPKGVVYREEKDFRVFVAGSPAFLDYFETQRGNERVVVQARPKDTLATIGARHGLSVGMMERINRRSRRDPLTPGDYVVVYVRRSGAQDRVGVAQ